MSAHEEELQRRIEQGEIFPDDNVDAKAYQHIFKSLKYVSDQKVSASFADRVIQKILAKKQEKESAKDLWWLGTGIFLLIVALIIAFYYIGFKPQFGFLSAVGEDKGLIFLAVLLIVVFNKFEKKLLSPKRIA
jgi:hypothetical protein